MASARESAGGHTGQWRRDWDREERTASGSVMQSDRLMDGRRGDAATAAARGVTAEAIAGAQKSDGEITS